MGAPPFDKLRAGFLPDIGRSGSATETSDQPANGNHGRETPKKRLNPIKRKQMEDRVHELEEDISRVEAAIAHCEAALQNFVSAGESQRQSTELEQNKASHADLVEEWEKLSEALQQSD